MLFQSVGVTDVAAFNVWCLSLLIEVCVVGWAVVGLALAIDKYAQTHGWQATRRLMPAIVIALLVCGFSIAESRTHLVRTVVQPSATVRAGCDGWMWYVNSACWF